MSDLRRGDVFWFVDPQHGPPVGVPHPHVIVSEDVFNRSRLPAVVVCGVSSDPKRAKEPGNVLLEPGEGGLERRSVVVVSQISYAPRDLLVRRIGAVSQDRVAEILDGLRFLQASFFRSTPVPPGPDGSTPP